jgi:hypothetical protein
MNVRAILMAIGFAAAMGKSAGAPEIPAAVGKVAAEKPLDQLIGELAHDQFRVREAASRNLWEMGAPALKALQDVAGGPDPERAYRARDLIQKIELRITPETDPSVLSLVERYQKASVDEKIQILAQLQKVRAWRQILKLYATDGNPNLQARLKESIRGIAVVAARERLLAGDPDGARDFLEMGPADASGLLALAEFHRSHGSLAAELERAKTLKGAKSQAWKLAIHRASGNLEAARDSATAAGEGSLAAAMALLLGDPLPWLRMYQASQGGEIPKSYTGIAIKRWQGLPLVAADLAPLLRSANSKNQSERGKSIGALFLLGEAKSAEDALVAVAPTSAFSYYDLLERVPEALQALGLDSEKPDYRSWVEKRMENLTKDDVEAEEDVSLDMPELILLANFLERRGLEEDLKAAFAIPLQELAKKDEKAYIDLLGSLFGNAESVGSAPRLAQRMAVEWAGEDPDRWSEVVGAAFGGEEPVAAWWNWLAELKPDSSRADRLEGLLALMAMIPDPSLLREKWLASAWENVEKAPADQRVSRLQLLAFLSTQSGDATTSLRVWDALPESAREGIFWRSHIGNLSAAERWDEAAAFFLKFIDRNSKLQQDPQPSFYACAAACLRKAGRKQEAATYDAWVEKLALGHDAAEIGNGYAFGYDYERAAEWWARAARQHDPEEVDFGVVLELHLEMLLERERWKEAASIAEVKAQMDAAGGSNGGSQATKLKVRLQADLSRALDQLPTTRSRAIEILERCQRTAPGDGFMADYFYPAIRQAGLLSEHDRWFAEAWKTISEVVKKYPGSDNTLNTAAWLASRACRNLDQAEDLMKKALAMNPNQAAYLDTMAEIQFAKGKRAAALDWSRQAMNYRPDDVMIRRQHERFSKNPLPR